MMNSTTYQKDLGNKTMTVTREFAAPVEQVWRAWTESELLDQWWAPKPWQAVTKSMNFTEGGYWLYYMLGPDGTKMYARIDYKKIVKPQLFEAVDSFCDEEGNQTHGFPSMYWKNSFSATATGTKVVVLITFESVEDIQKIVDLGFQEGFSMAHDNLDLLLAK